MIKIEHDRDMVIFRDEGGRELGYLPAGVFDLAVESIQKMVSTSQQKVATTIYLNRKWSLVITCYGGIGEGAVLLELLPRNPPRCTVDWLPEVPTRG